MPRKTTAASRPNDCQSPGARTAMSFLPLLRPCIMMELVSLHQYRVDVRREVEHQIVGATPHRLHCTALHCTALHCTGLFRNQASPWQRARRCAIWCACHPAALWPRSCCTAINIINPTALPTSPRSGTGPCGSAASGSGPLCEAHKPRTWASRQCSPPGRCQ